MGVQGYLPKSPESVIYCSSPTALGQRRLAPNLQCENEQVVLQRSSARSVALAVGGGLSLSAFTLNWLGRKSRRPARSFRRPVKAVSRPKVQDPEDTSVQNVVPPLPCVTCLDKRRKPLLEECSQVNYLSPFLLTSLLLPRLEQSEEARIVHVWGKISVEEFRRRKVLDLEFPKRQMRMLGNLGGSYADSKLAQVLFSQALARRLPANVVTHSLHPAIVQPTAQHGRNVNSSTCCLFGAYLISQCIL
eukprot:g16053.t1